MITITNETQLVVGWNLAFRPDGREALVVVAKGSFVLVDPEARTGEPRFCGEQAPLLMADEFGKDPAKSAPILENDFAPVKPECDVLFVGSAYSPYEQLVTSLDVGLRVGGVSKSFKVLGPRQWVSGATGRPLDSMPTRMKSQPISYDVAFGGVEEDPKNPERVETYLDNPVGRGFRRKNLDVIGQLMPATEELSQPIRDPLRSYRPMALGPLGRSWGPRMQYAGTYDDDWIENVAPMLPPDFNPLYFQAAPADQRMPYPAGGEPIRLVNLVPPTASPAAGTQNHLPKLPVMMVFVPRQGDAAFMDAALDTIVIEPDLNRFTCTWRASNTLVRDLFEMREVVICLRAPDTATRLRARLRGKEYLAGLSQLKRKGSRP